MGQHGIDCPKLQNLVVGQLALAEGVEGGHYRSSDSGGVRRNFRPL